MVSVPRNEGRHGSKRFSVSQLVLDPRAGLGTVLLGGRGAAGSAVI
jgi:hypothetical protein